MIVRGLRQLARRLPTPTLGLAAQGNLAAPASQEQQPAGREAEGQRHQDDNKCGHGLCTARGTFSFHGHETEQQPDPALLHIDDGEMVGLAGLSSSGPITGP